MAETLGRIKYIYPAVFILKKLRHIIKTHERCIKIYDISKGKKKDRRMGITKPCEARHSYLLGLYCA